MTKKNVTGEVTAKPSRRKFLKAGTVGAAGAATLGFPMVSFAQTKTLKMQAAWGGGIFLENAKAYVERVHAMAGRDLKIDLLPVNSVVKTSQMQDAVHRGVLDAAHYVPAYWYSKSKAASLFGTGPCFGWSSQEVLGWVHYGGGQELFDELMGSLGLNVVSFFNSPMPAQPLGWFKEEIKDSSQMNGLKYRTVGLAADVLLEMGMSVVQLPGGEIQPAMKSGLIDAAEFNNPTSDRDFGMQDVSKHYHLASFHQSQEFFEVTFNKGKYERAARRAEGHSQARFRGRELELLLAQHEALRRRPGQAAGARASTSTGRPTRSCPTSSRPGTWSSIVSRARILSSPRW